MLRERLLTAIAAVPPYRLVSRKALHLIMPRITVAEPHFHGAPGNALPGVAGRPRR